MTVQILSPPTQQFANSLRQNYPNPFSSWTVFRYSLARASRVTLVVYSITGQRVVTLFDGYRSPGAFTVTWDGRGSDGRRVASGVYMYRATMAGFSQTRKLSLTR